MSARSFGQSPGDLPWKGGLLGGKGLIYRYFPDPIFLLDAADSPYLYAYVDFGWLGLLLYPCVMGLLWMSVLMLLLLLQRPLFVWVVFSAWPPMFLLSLGEGAMTGWFATGG